jgi:hypothetical protein
MRIQRGIVSRKCMFLTSFSDPTLVRKVWVVVIDGITIGRPCCGVHNCFEPLPNNNDRFCSVHVLTHNNICVIVGCNNNVMKDRLTCAIPDHQAVENLRNDRGKARFQLQHRLQRARVSHPNNTVAEDQPTSEIANADDAEEEFEIPQHHLATATGNPKKLRAQFGRRRTHNEQIIVAPCGIIIARETFYGAEGVASVVEMIKNTFNGDIKPDHIFFDNNCSLAKMAKGDPFFANIGLTVDVFHFKCKHSEKDEFCQSNCNPVAYPELLGEDGTGWYFNSSIAEQTNVWLGGYHSMCREMRADRYTFFLDEMILRKNRLVRKKLEKEMKMPNTWPVM